MKVQHNRITGQFIIALPKAISHAMNWKKGDDISVTVLGRDKLKLEKVS